MNLRLGLRIAAAAFLLLFAAVISYQYYFKKPPLTVYLRCAEDVSGKLTVSLSSEDKKETLDVAEACLSGKISVSGYKREEEAHFTFENKTGERGDLLSKYGTDIQSDQNGFNMILKITAESPFISNEKL